jgi:hypothetical protein
MVLSTLGLNPTTPLGKEEAKKLNLLLQMVWDNNDSFEFRQPVDYKALQLFDYPEIVKNPMDLSTIKKRLNGGK